MSLCSMLATFSTLSVRVTEMKTQSKTETSWIDELIKWENAHPEYQPFKEDKDSQRQQNFKENY